MEHSEQAERQFDALWEEMADRGACDSLGGAEYRRTKAAWFAAGFGIPLREFIRRSANISWERFPILDN